MTWDTNFDRKIVLDDGTEIYGYGFGASITKTAEIVFNTSVVGYQEILSDPSYTDQAVVMTYPLIGNYGMAKEDYETEIPTIGAMIVREYTPIPSNFRSANTLDEIACPRDQVFSVQYHPESAPGPQDSAYLFDQFLAMMEEHHNAKTH